MKLKLLDFIRNNDNWEEVLTKPPYSIKISRYKNYILFKYSQIESDFSLDIVRECRGIILNEKTLEIVCFPFVKFFNVGEEYADKIDWNTAIVQEKIDGSLIKLWCDKSEQGYYEWHFSTNGSINAFECDLPTDLSNYKTFGDLFMSVFNKDILLNLNKDYTYMFELVSPYNKIVVPYPIVDIYHIGTRNNKTYEEIEIDIGIKKPNIYNLFSQKEVENAASKLPFSEEGYVVVDKNYNRVKIKSPAYVNAHRLVNNHSVNAERILSLILENEQSEFLSYFPEYQKDFNHMIRLYNKYQKDLEHKEQTIRKLKESSKDRKSFALTSKSRYPNDISFCFMIYDNSIKDYQSYINQLGAKKLLERIKLYENN